jgi:PAS domain S-box-containing protein
LIKQTILVVDDTPSNIMLLVEILKDDYTVIVAETGAQALAIATSEKAPDLVLLDIMMPQMDGYEVCRRLKLDPQTRNLPVIFLTALDNEEDETKGFALGADDYITKPFSATIVKARVRTHLQAKLYREHLEETVKDRTTELIELNERLMKDIAERKLAEQELEKARNEEIKLLEMTTALSSELNLERLLAMIMETTILLLSADRCTLFMSDEKTNELWSIIASGMEIRFPNHKGIAGSVFTTGETINIPDAYSDERFNPEVDKQTGYRTQSILCMPIKTKSGHTLGVAQVLNKKGGPFTGRDERRLKAFSAQVSVTLENAKLFEDILNMKNYNESLLESMKNGILSLGADKTIIKCNSASLAILHVQQDILIGSSAVDFFVKENKWVLDSIDKVMATKTADYHLDADIFLSDGNSVSVNLSIVPLINVHKELIGSLLVIEDITSEKRMKSTIARYMTKEISDKLLSEDGESALGGQIHEATVMFSDIRDFTTLSEKHDPQDTVNLLNEYLN